MDNHVIGSKVRWLRKYAYYQRKNAKGSLPGPWYDVTLVALFIAMGLGLLVVR